jgi:phage portal protein BeeE
MGLLDKVAAEVKQERKGFSEPNFWDMDRFRNGWYSSSVNPDKERIENDFVGYAEGGYKASSVLFTCISIRQLIFSEARFMWRPFRSGRPGQMFGNRDLSILERPWPNGTTGELLSRMELDASLAGNAFGVVVDDAGRVGARATGHGRRIACLRPDWMTIVLGSVTGDPRAADAKPVGYIYEPPATGIGTNAGPTVYMPDEIFHYSPLPDPTARFRGMSWVTPVLRDVSADRASTQFRYNFLDRGATLGTVVSLDKDVSPEAFDSFVSRFKEQHEGADNAFKTLFLGGGADVSVVGSSLQQMDMRQLQGAGETRIAAASGVGAVIAQFSEGMQGSSLNAGNFVAARRRVGDGLFRPLWRMAAASLESILDVPGDSHLWYDDRDIPFLREDRDRIAQIQAQEASVIRQLIDGGFSPDSVTEAVAAADWSLLVHTGLMSVQLQTPGAQNDRRAELDGDPLPSNDEE